MNGTAAGVLSTLLDAAPVIALLLLALDFIRCRHRCRNEERRLREAISAFRAAENQAPKPANEEEETRDIT